MRIFSLENDKVKGFYFFQNYQVYVMKNFKKGFQIFFHVSLMGFLLPLEGGTTQRVASHPFSVMSPYNLVYFLLFIPLVLGIYCYTLKCPLEG